MVVIGPFHPLDWLTLRELHESIASMEEEDSEFFKGCIRKERDIYRNILSNYLRSKEDT